MQQATISTNFNPVHASDIEITHIFEDLQSAMGAGNKDLTKEKAQTLKPLIQGRIQYLTDEASFMPFDVTYQLELEGILTLTEDLLKN